MNIHGCKFPPDATVGMEHTFYTVLESDVTVEVCAVVYEPITDCPVEFSFDLRLYTVSGSAGNVVIETYAGEG